MGEDRTWVFEAMSQFLKGPQWALPVWDFIDENCVVFDSLEENQHAHFEVHNAFKDTVESLLEMMLEELSVTPEEFFQLMQSYGTSDVGKEVFEQILAVDDFVSFKQMMVKRNMELELDSMNALQNLAQQVDAGEVAEPAPPTEEDDEEAQLQVRRLVHASLLCHGMSVLVSCTLHGQPRCKCSAPVPALRDRIPPALPPRRKRWSSHCSSTRGMESA